MGIFFSRITRKASIVKKGDLLFQIDDRTYQAVLDEAVARQVKTEQDVQRYTPLAKTQAISQQELDDAIQANLAAKAAVDAAQLNVQFCKIISPVDGIAGLAQAQIGDLLGPGSGPLTTVVKVDPIKVYFSVSQDLMTRIQMKMLAAGKAIRPDPERYVSGSTVEIDHVVRYHLSAGRDRSSLPTIKWMCVPVPFVSAAYFPIPRAFFFPVCL